MGSERRRSPRILIDPIRARVSGLAADVTIDEVGFGGFRVKSATAFELHAEYEFVVSPRTGRESRRVKATAIHCRALSTDPESLFETGFAFAESVRSTAGIEAILGGVRPAPDTSRRQPLRVRVVPGR